MGKIIEQTLQKKGCDKLEWKSVVWFKALLGQEYYSSKFNKDDINVESYSYFLVPPFVIAKTMSCSKFHWLIA